MPLVSVIMMAVMLTNAPAPNMDQGLIPDYKKYAELIDADWQLLAAYDLAIHNNQAVGLDPEKTAWFFLSVEYDGLTYSGKTEIMNHIGNNYYTFEEVVQYLKQRNEAIGTDIYKIEAKTLVTLEATLPKEVFKWIETIVSGNGLAKLAGDATYIGGNYGKLVLENKGFFAVPLPAGSYKVSSRGFGYRLHPVHKVRKFHSGQDFPAPAGTPVGAAADGTVKTGQDPNGYGNYVKITHQNGFVTLYGHLLSFNVRKGQIVKKGDCIGFVGSTGTSTGNHLHFEIRKDGQYLDPMKFLR